MKNTSSVYLRALEPDDYKVSIDWRRNDEIWDMVGGPKYFVSEAYEKSWVEHAIADSQNLRLAICLSDDHRYIGNVGVTDINTTNRSCQIHIIIGEKSFWNRGCGKQAIEQLVAYLFGERNMHRIEIRVLERNAASLKMFQKCGAQIEGTLRDAVYKNGSYQNQVILSIINDK